ncbi:hypothetical protein [Blastococcus sp. PRF04-17]|uniref:hypothetical protein n=1 Tax=Blastococcus sp. PRF04-17 TaxID=2933797 RepID=UPI001FF69B14|nr:hypothetical protein [Blastococcus sp. PRF04-17]UOY00201.1 hypothetical protein MVA48_14445 [Blastococcus sp. PRF04-17]
MSTTDRRPESSRSGALLSAHCPHSSRSSATGSTASVWASPSSPLTVSVTARAVSTSQAVAWSQFWSSWQAARSSTAGASSRTSPANVS